MGSLLDKINFKNNFFGIAMSCAIGVGMGIPLAIANRDAEIKHTYTKVVEKRYTPRESGINVSRTLIDVGESFGIGGNGFGINIGGLNFSSTADDEEYNVFFECRDGRSFGAYECLYGKYLYPVSKKLYDKLSEDQEVDISYKILFGVQDIKPISK